MGGGGGSVSLRLSDSTYPYSSGSVPLGENVVATAMLPGM